LAKAIVKQIKSNGLPKGTLLNINVPSGAIKGIVYSPRKTEFRVEINALKAGYITISPLDEDLSDYHSLDHFKDWNLGFKVY
jgi:broad specificity polyphosphatase/5'/3'-nucleotidase SurE